MKNPSHGQCFSLNETPWTVTGWYPNFWRMVKSAELDQVLKPVVPPIPATVPGAVQTDLLRVGIASDPNAGLNSLADEWIPNREWIYETTFRCESLQDAERQRWFLVFEGLDFHGEIRLNGKHLRDFSGMFIPIEVDVTEELSDSGSNSLRVVFHQAPEVAGQAGYTSRIRTIKSRFNYNWDWCARIVPVGIWDDVYLKRTGSIRLLDFWPEALLQYDNTNGILTINAEFDAIPDACEYGIEWKISRNGGMVLEGREEAVFPRGYSRWSKRLQLDQVEAWWPRGLGEQPLYDVEFRVMANGCVSDQAGCRVGFKRVEWRRNLGAPETALPYTAIINGQRLFLRGVNWVPISPFYGSVTRADYELHAGRFAEMNCNILRVWGGGIIEKRAFYDVCDELGLLVWQEFPQSSSGVENLPPDDPEYLSKLSAVAESAIRRRRHHVCLVIWCGGNELMYEASSRPVGEEHVNLRLLGQLVRELHPLAHYLPSSPSGPVFIPSVEDYGKDVCHDTHGHWLYLGDTLHYDYYDRDDSLWRSEVGTPGLAQAETLSELAGDHMLWPPNASNRLWLHHGPWWIAWSQMAELFGPWDEGVDEMSLYAKLSQYLQAESLRYVVESVRRREPASSGVLIWMGNEPYNNGANTSLIDYKARPKPAFYSVAGSYQDSHVSLQYGQVAWKKGDEFRATVYMHGCRKEWEPIDVSLLDGTGNVLERWCFDTVDGPAIRAGEIRWHVESCPSSIFLVQLQHEGVERNTYIFTIDQSCPFAAMRHLLPTRIKPEYQENRLTIKNTGEFVALQVIIASMAERTQVSVQPNNLVLFPGESSVLSVKNPAGERLYATALNAEDRHMPVLK